MLFILAKMIIRLVDPIRNMAWKVIMNHNEDNPVAVARFCFDTLRRGGMSVRIVPNDAPNQEPPSEGFLN